jgi:hypothetical protein
MSGSTEEPDLRATSTEDKEFLSSGKEKACSNMNRLFAL